MADRSRVAILISGRGSNMAALIYASRAAGCAYEVAVVTGDNPDAPGLALAEAERVPVVRLPRPGKDKSQFFDALQKVLEDHDVDLVALAGFMRIIPADFIGRWSGRILNIHPSMLPKYKGLGTHDAALAAGDQSTGATVHLVTNELAWRFVSHSAWVERPSYIADYRGTTSDHYPVTTRYSLRP